MRAAVFLVAVACATSGILSPDERRDLQRAEARWKARPFADYSFEIRISCFCPPEIAQWTRVSVRGGVVIDAAYVVPDPQVPPPNRVYWTPIDSLFPRIRRASAEDWLQDIDVMFDATLGFPTRVDFRAKSNVADGGALYELRSVQPLP